jgi:hypothetical protein
LLLLGLGALGAVTTGCGGVTQNVRAYRAYADEDPNIKVAIDRVEDLVVTLELVDRILTGTNYTPGDLWPRRLPMTDGEYHQIKDDLRDRFPYKGLEHVEIPIIKCYRMHIEQTLREYGPTPDKAKYPSLFDALGSLSPRTKDIKAHWAAYHKAAVDLAAAVEEHDKVQSEDLRMNEQQRKAHAPVLAAANDKVARAHGEVTRTGDLVNQDALNLTEDAKLSGGEKQQIARDAFYAISVAFRVELEALAMIPIIVIQAVRGIPTAPRDLTYKSNLKIAKTIYDMPSNVKGIKESMTRQAGLLDDMTGKLAKAFNTTTDKSPGFELRESVVDQVVGITLDSFRVDLKAGADAFIYSSVGTSDRSGDKNTSYDYRGRQYKLDYRIQPIVLASARLDVVLDWIRLPGAADLGFGYSTDRVWKSGGSVENTSLTQQLGITGIASDVIDAGLGLLGIRTGVKIATFTAGELHQVKATDVATSVSSSPLQLKYTQADVGYDLLWLITDDSFRAYTEELVVGGRYVNYTLPRIVYELQDTSTVAGQQHFTFFRETPAQNVNSQYWMAAVSARFGQGDAPRFSPFLDLGLSGGLGPTKFYFLKDNGAPDTEANRLNDRDLAWAVNAGVGAGLRMRLLPRGWRVRMDLRIQYHADLIYSKVNVTDTNAGRALSADFGSFDIFHAPSIAFRGAL